MPEMSTSNWLTLVGAVIGIAVTWGAMQTKLSGVLEKVAELKSQIAELKASRDKSGERAGKLERDVELLRFALNERTRRHTLVPDRKDTPPEGEST